MATKGKFLGSTSITNSYSITLIKIVREHLEIETGNLIGFYSTKENNLIITPSQIDNLADLSQLALLGASTLTASNTVTLPKKVRRLLKVNKGDKLAYYDDSIRRIRVTTG